MSAIWGIISVKGNAVSNENSEFFEAVYNNCVIDRREVFCDSNVLMGCEIQYFAPQAVHERLPMCDKKEKVYFTADVYIDNREEILQDAIFSGVDKNKISDGEILFHFYRKYGKERLAEVIGSYSFVYYNQELGYADLVMDHTGNRCLYYAQLNDTIYFSTLMKPLWLLLKDKLHKNKRTFVDFAALPDYRVYMDYEATIFEEIKHGVAGQIIRFWQQENRIEKIEYWNPLKNVKMLLGKSDEEYKKLLLDTFSETVKNSIRTKDKVGITLSGGLDSTAVACFASPIIRERGEKLYAYTMVPKLGYKDDTQSKVNVDEKYLAQCTAKHLGNVVECYDSFEEMSAWNIRHEQMSLLEGPYKSLQNVMWVKNLATKAYADGCRVLLNGQLGNDTISYGDSNAYLYELLIQGHWVKLWQEINTRSKYRYYRKKKVIACLWNIFWGKHNGRFMSKKEFFETSFVKQSVLEEYKVYNRIEKRAKEISKIKTRKDYNKLILDKMRFRQIGDNETRISLYSGVLCKDPTRSPQLLELCLSFPTEQFNKGCTPRRLIYEYMKEYFPKELLDERLPKGRQSADFCYRLSDSWDEIYKKMYELFSGSHEELNNDKLLEVLQMVRDSFESHEEQLDNRKMIERLFYALQVYELEEMYF